jgi:hypothetical protein
MEENEAPTWIDRHSINCTSCGNLIDERYGEICGECQPVTVCSECKQASCWYGLFMCDKAQSAGIILLPIRELRKLNLEHPSYWTEESVRKYTGVSR